MSDMSPDASSMRADMEKVVYREVGELQAALEAMKLTGKSIEKVGIVADLEYMDRDRMIDLYNNFVAGKGEKLRHTWEPIYADEIPLDIEINRFFTTRGPLVIVFCDGLALGITASDFGAFQVETRTADEVELNPHVDVDRLLRPVLGETVSGIEIAEIPEGYQERLYLEGGNVEHPPRSLKMHCDTHMLYVSYAGFGLHEADDPWPLGGLTLAELREAVDYWDSLFDSRS